jgi:hypothetical protein
LEYKSEPNNFHCVDKKNIGGSGTKIIQVLVIIHLKLALMFILMYVTAPSRQQRSFRLDLPVFFNALAFLNVPSNFALGSFLVKSVKGADYLSYFVGNLRGFYTEPNGHRLSFLEDNREAYLFSLISRIDKCL